MKKGISPIGRVPSRKISNRLQLFRSPIFPVFMSSVKMGFWWEKIASLLPALVLVVSIVSWTSVLTLIIFGVHWAFCAGKVIYSVAWKHRENVGEIF